MQTINIKIGGEAGQGLVSVGNILLKAIAREGWHLFAHQDYQSRIRGGHNFFQIRLGDQPVRTLQGPVDILVSLDKASIPLHRGELTPTGIVLYDPEVCGLVYEKPGFLQVPFTKVATGLGQPAVMANAVAAGAVWALLSVSLDSLAVTLTEMFAEKGENVVKGNLAVAQAGFELVQRSVGGRLLTSKPSVTLKRLVLKGNDALPLGALAAGVKFMSAYPMTPSTGVTEFIAAQGERCSVVMEQAEDEISAINMAIGASYAGVRAMTATSGGGFALMTEALGLAGCAEIPIVVINAQRPGPSTGLPTRTEQGDLLYAVATSFGDFPRAVLAPGDVEEAFYLMGDAFNLAEKYQMPVIVLSDQHLADSYQTVEIFDLERIKIDRGEIAHQPGQNYRRYRITESGISPRLYPGSSEGLVVSTGDEHDEEGHLNDDAENRILMMEKRMRKMQLVTDEALPPVVYGSESPEVVLVGFGSTKGAIQEVVDTLLSRGIKAQGVHLPQVFPLPKKLQNILEGAGKKYVIEGNYSGQLARLLAMEFAWRADGYVRRFDGRPLEPAYILQNLAGGEYCD